MENIAGDKMFGYIDRIAGEHKPITADIFLTNYCNNKCPYCTYRRWELDADAYSMKYEEFIVYAERLLELGVQGLILTGGGEPTICKDFKAITEWLEMHGIHYGVNTNFNQLEYIRPDYLKVSLDGWDEKSYKASRGVEAYKRVRDNIAKYAVWKEMHSPLTSLGIQRVVNNVEDVQKFYEANKDLPVDYISFRPIESTFGVFYNHEYAAQEVFMTVQAVKEQQKKDERVTLNFKWDMLNEAQRTCTAQWAQIAVNERGQVMYCCHKPYQIVGHVLDDDILEKKARAATDMRRCDIPCRMTAPNAFVAEVEKPRKDIFFI